MRSCACNMVMTMMTDCSFYGYLGIIKGIISNNKVVIMVGTTIKQRTNGERLWITNNSCLITNSMFHVNNYRICLFLHKSRSCRQTGLASLFLPCNSVCAFRFCKQQSIQDCNICMSWSKFTPVVCEMSVSSLLLTNTSAVLYR